jgi:hypothetical protein
MTITVGVRQMPCNVLGAQSEVSVRSAYERGWMVDLDWMTWTRTVEGQTLMAGGDALVRATPDDLVRM